MKSWTPSNKIVRQQSLTPRKLHCCHRKSSHTLSPRLFLRNARHPKRSRLQASLSKLGVPRLAPKPSCNVAKLSSVSTAVFFHRCCLRWRERLSHTNLLQTTQRQSIATVPLTDEVLDTRDKRREHTHSTRLSRKYVTHH